MPKELSKQHSADEEELQLWIAFQRYMRGEISIEELEAIQLPQNQNVRKAIMALSGHSIKKRFLNVLNLRSRRLPGIKENYEQQTADEKELIQWIAFQQYMRGEISIEELEAIQLPQNQNVHKAIIMLAKQGIKRRLLKVLHLR